MSKVQTLSGQQRLRQLAKRQLGGDFQSQIYTQAASTNLQSADIRTESVVDQHARRKFPCWGQSH